MKLTNKQNATLNLKSEGFLVIITKVDFLNLKTF